jgi:hypothetical protein
MLQLPMTDPSHPFPLGTPRRTAVNRRKLEALPHRKRRALMLALFIISLSQERLDKSHHEFALLLVKTFYHLSKELRIRA